MMPKYSIIIPTLNEENNIQKLLEHLLSFKVDFEIIISDGGSSDNTLKIAKKYNVKIIHSVRGRGLQLNEGTKYAEGNIYIYLHADTFLPGNAFTLISKYFTENENGIATFKLNFDSDNLLMKAYGWLTKFDSMFTTFGDQVIVINKQLLDDMGGFPNIKFFEDVEFLRKVRKTRKIHKFHASVITSGRRFYSKGIVLTQILNIYYFVLYLFKINPDKIYEKYFYDRLK